MSIDDIATLAYDDADAELVFAKLIAAANNRPWVQERLGRLAALGDDLGASMNDIIDVMREYLRAPEDWNFGLQHKRLLCKAWELPEEAVNSPLTVGDLIEFGGNLQSASNKGIDVLRDPKTWKLVKLRGRGGKKEADEIVKEAWSEDLGVPKDTAFRLTLEQLTNGVVGLQQRGMDGMVGDSDFWGDYTKSVDKPGVFNRWQKRAEDEDKAAAARRDREINNKLMEFKRAMAERDREWERLRLLREQDRQRRIIEQKRKKKRRRRGIKGVVSTEESEISIMRRVATPWGSNYILRTYGDGTSELIRIEADGEAVVVIQRGSHAYCESRTPSGMLHVVPAIGYRTGKRRASPMDLPQGQRRGSVGMDN